jgi:hypothetical protein
MTQSQLLAAGWPCAGGCLSGMQRRAEGPPRSRVSPQGAYRRKGVSVSLIDESNDDAALEECIESLDGLFISLDRYPPTVVAMAIGIYLEGLLGALLDEGQCTGNEVRQLLAEIESGVLAPQDATVAGDGEPEAAGSRGGGRPRR